MVKQVWWELENCREYLNEKFASFHDLLQGILAQKNPKLAELFGFIGWSIWYERNARRMGTPSLPMKRIYKDAVECMKDFQSIQEGSGIKQQCPTQPTGCHHFHQFTKLTLTEQLFRTPPRQVWKC